MIQFVHVGKTGGESIECVLAHYSLPVRSHHCFDADLSIQELLSIKDKKAPFFLVSVRDPIKRFVSAFYWDYYEKILVGDKPGPDDAWKKLYETFPTPNLLAESLSSDLSESLDLAMSAFSPQVKLHMSMGLSWYLRPKNIHLLSCQNCFVVRTENLTADISEYLHKWHRITLDMKVPKSKFKYKSEIPNYDASLSQKAICNLRKCLAKDYRVLEYFRKVGLLDGRVHY